MSIWKIGKINLLDCNIFVKPFFIGNINSNHVSSPNVATRVIDKRLMPAGDLNPRPPAPNSNAKTTRPRCPLTSGLYYNTDKCRPED